MKAQIIGQVFIYTLSAIVFGVILLFGYKAITNFIQKSDDIALIDLKNELQSAVNSIGSSPDVQKRAVYLPTKYKQVCLLGNVSDAQKSATCLCTGVPGCIGASESDLNPMLCDIWRSGTRQNVFLVPMADIEIVVSKIELDNYYLCAHSVKGKIEFRLQGTGDATLIREW